jgi:alpha-tubulin suppressor-like RCC1 family protein
MRTTSVGNTKRKALGLALIAALALIVLAPAVGYAEGGEAVGWGENFHMQLDAGYKNIQEERPVGVQALTNVTAVASGDAASAALLANGTVRSWGDNGNAQLGDGSELGTWDKQATTVAVSGLTAVTQISSANAHSIALLASGEVETWGTNQDGQTGNGTGGVGTISTTPQLVEGLTGVTQVAAAGGANFALLSNHTVLAWGENNAGQLGIGEGEPEECKTEVGWERCSKLPRLVRYAGGEVVGNVVSIASGGGEAGYAVLESGHVLSWGNNGKGQLGTGYGEKETRPFHTPTEVKGVGGTGTLSGVVAVSGGTYHALALRTGGEVVGWGANEKGAVGGSPVTECGAKTGCDPTPVTIAGLKENVSQVSAGTSYSLALKEGKVFALGDNENGTLANGGIENSNVATAISGLSSVTQIAAGNTHALALLASGVAAPAPLVTATPASKSVKVHWTVTEPEYKVRWTVLGEHKLTTVTKAEAEHEYTITGLSPETTYEVILVAGEQVRKMIAKPLP